MAIEGVLHLDGGNVLAAGDDDVLKAVLDFQVAVFVPYRQVAGVEPAATERFFGGFGVLEVAFHHGVATQEDLTNGFTVLGDRFHGTGVTHHGARQRMVANALTSLDGGPLVQGFLIPFGLPGTHGDRAVNFRQAVNMSDGNAHLLDGANDLGGRGCASRHGFNVVIDAGLGGFRHVQKRVKHNGSTAHVGYLVITDQLQDFFRIHPAQANVSARQSGNGPGETPAVTVKHRQGPQVDRMLAHGPHRLIAHAVHVGTAMVINDAFRVTGGAGGVVQGDGIPFVLWQAPLELRVTFLQEDLIIQVAHLCAFTVLRVIHINHQRLFIQAADGVADNVAKFPVRHNNLGFPMLQHEGNGLGVQAHIQGIENRPDHGHTKVTLHHGRDIGQHRCHGVAAANATTSQCRGQTAATLVSFAPVITNGPVNHRGVFRIHACRALNKIDGGQNRIIGVDGLQALIKNRGHCCGPLGSIVLVVYSVSTLEKLYSWLTGMVLDSRYTRNYTNVL